MTEIKFSLIGELTPTMESILKDFETQNNHRVVTETMSWEVAWQQILSWTLQENSPHISQVGATWGASLFKLNALRPFTLTEVRSMGSQIAFLPQAWQSAQPGGTETWAMPWNTYTFLLAYRKDLLNKAGIDEQNAFSTFDDLAQTLMKLRESGVKNPWVVPASKAHLATLHYLASWVWDAGGDFISADGQHAAYNQPDTLKAIIRYFDLLRYMKRVPLPLTEEGALGMFVQGDAAVTIAGAAIPYSWISNHLITDQFMENLGFAPMPGVPWVGGDHLVIWKQALISPEIEKASLDLVRYLISQPIQEANAHGDDVHFPSRPGAFGALPFQGSQLTESILQSLHAGRSHRSTAHWSKIEHHFARAFGEISENILKGMQPAEAVTDRLETLATWFNAMLR
jgi:multiple sugar transport system substrate-binding protein